MNPRIKIIEDLSLNAWPSYWMQLYDGWILRFSYFYTHRTNSVEQIGTSTIPLEEKINYCEDIYRHWGTPAIFKISPLVDPAFDTMLEKRDYQIQHTTDVMSMQLKDATLSLPTHKWNLWFYSAKLDRQSFSLKGTTNVMHKMVVPSMYRAIPKDTICASIQKGGKIIATRLGF